MSYNKSKSKYPSSSEHGKKKFTILGKINSRFSGKNDFPSLGKEIPDSREKIPILGEKFPILGEKIPDFREKLMPDPRGKNSRFSGENFPILGEKVPNSRGKNPDSWGEIPDYREFIFPENRDFSPRIVNFFFREFQITCGEFGVTEVNFWSPVVSLKPLLNKL